MEPKDFSPRIRIEQEYKRRILSLLDRYLQFPEAITLGQITEALVNFSNLSRFFEQSAESIASRMATQVAVSNARSWREAARQSSRGRVIYNALEREMEGDIGTRVRQIVSENARLISSIPSDIREQVNREISSMERQGLRPEAIAGYLRRRIPKLTRSKAALIARTETGKSSTALTQARSEDLDLPCYEWETSRDSRVRPSHRNMQGVIVFWNDPPAPEALIGEKSRLGHYHASSAPNCRCPALPLLRLSAISWPHKVYRQGRISTMTLSQFRKILPANTGLLAA